MPKQSTHNSRLALPGRQLTYQKGRGKKKGKWDLLVQLSIPLMQENILTIWLQKSQKKYKPYQSKVCCIGDEGCVKEYILL